MNPRYLYRKLFAGDDVAMEDFLATVCTEEWNERQDAGRSFADAVAELLPRHADKAELIERMCLGTGLRHRAKEEIQPADFSRRALAWASRLRP